MMTTKISDQDFSVIPGIEIGNIAINDTYRDNHKDELENIKLGYYIFVTFISPIVENVKKYIGAKHLFLFALPKNKLIKTYESWGFCRLNEEAEKYLNNHTKSSWAKNCIFMSQALS